MVSDIVDAHPSLLPHLALHRLLDALSRLDKSSQAAKKAFRPCLLSAQEQLAAVVRLDSHDDDGVCARICKIVHSLLRDARRTLCRVDLVGEARALPPSPHRAGRVAASRAKLVLLVPVHQCPRLGHDARALKVDAEQFGAQVDEHGVLVAPVRLFGFCSELRVVRCVDDKVRVARWIEACVSGFGQCVTLPGSALVDAEEDEERGGSEVCGRLR